MYSLLRRDSLNKRQRKIYTELEQETKKTKESCSSCSNSLDVFNFKETSSNLDQFIEMYKEIKEIKQLLLEVKEFFQELKQLLKSNNPNVDN